MEVSLDFGVLEDRPGCIRDRVVVIVGLLEPEFGRVRSRHLNILFDFLGCAHRNDGTGTLYDRDGPLLCSSARILLDPQLVVLARARAGGISFRLRRLRLDSVLLGSRRLHAAHIHLVNVVEEDHAGAQVAARMLRLHLLRGTHKSIRISVGKLLKSIVVHVSDA